MEKADNTQEQMHNLSREGEMLRKYEKEMLEPSWRGSAVEH